jgi:hypothetical protein
MEIIQVSATSPTSAVAPVSSLNLLLRHEGSRESDFGLSKKEA